MLVVLIVMTQTVNMSIKLSVVIPTLGGSQLNETISSILQSTLVPDEILICLPKFNELFLEEKLINKVQIIRTDEKAQVLQRSIGFCSARGDFVLQLDDDVILEKDCILTMWQFLNTNKESASVAPVFHNKSTKAANYYNHDSFFRKALYWLLNGDSGFQAGKISLSGMAFIFDFQDKKNSINKVDWLPGGCVLHKKESLILENYYPFNGKAYGEDLIHSFILRKNLVNLYVHQDAIAFLDFVHIKHSLVELRKEYYAVKYHCILMSKNLTRIRLYYAIHFFRFIFDKIIDELKIILKNMRRK